MRNRAIGAGCLLTIMITACGSAEQPEVVEQIVVREPGDPAPVIEAPTGDLVALGEDVFQTCNGCHTNEAGAPSSAGPNLYGVVGRVAGSLEDYPYSEALAASETVWDAETLDGYLADPAGYLPGTDMLAGAVPDADNRAAVIAYLSNESE